MERDLTSESGLDPSERQLCPLLPTLMESAAKVSYPPHLRKTLNENKDAQIFIRVPARTGNPAPD